jgi:hypothetical protein
MATVGSRIDGASPTRDRHRAPVGAVRVLGGCGLASAALSMLAGFLNYPLLLGIAGGLMVAGNVYAIARGGARP